MSAMVIHRMRFSANRARRVEGPDKPAGGDSPDYPAEDPAENPAEGPAIGRRSESLEGSLPKSSTDLLLADILKLFQGKNVQFNQSAINGEQCIPQYTLEPERVFAASCQLRVQSGYRVLGAVNFLLSEDSRVCRVGLSYPTATLKNRIEETFEDQLEIAKAHFLGILLGLCAFRNSEAIRLPAHLNRKLSKKNLSDPIIRRCIEGLGALADVVKFNSGVSSVQNVVVEDRLHSDTFRVIDDQHVQGAVSLNLTLLGGSQMQKNSLKSLLARLFGPPPQKIVKGSLIIILHTPLKDALINDVIESAMFKVRVASTGLGFGEFETQLPSHELCTAFACGILKAAKVSLADQGPGEGGPQAGNLF